MRRRWLAGMGVLVVVAAGCGGSDDDDENTASGPTPGSETSDVAPGLAPSALVDPCTVMSDAELREFGQDPATRRPESSRTGRVGGCGWNGKVVTLGLVVGNESLDDFRRRGDVIKDQFPVFGDVVVDGRPAVQYSVEYSTAEACAISFSVGSGVFDILVGDASSLDAPQDLCPVAQEAMKVIAAKLPKQGG